MSEVPDPLFAEAKIIPFPIHKVRQVLGIYDRFAPVSHIEKFGPLITMLNEQGEEVVDITKVEDFFASRKARLEEGLSEH